MSYMIEDAVEPGSDSYGRLPSGPSASAPEPGQTASPESRIVRPSIPAKQGKSALERFFQCKQDQFDDKHLPAIHVFDMDRLNTLSERAVRKSLEDLDRKRKS